MSKFRYSHSSYGQKSSFLLLLNLGAKPSPKFRILWGKSVANEVIRHLPSQKPSCESKNSKQRDNPSKVIPFQIHTHLSISKKNAKRHYSIYNIKSRKKLHYCRGGFDRRSFCWYFLWMNWCVVASYFLALFKYTHNIFSPSMWVEVKDWISFSEIKYKKRVILMIEWYNVTIFILYLNHKRRNNGFSYYITARVECFKYFFIFIYFLIR